MTNSLNLNLTIAGKNYIANMRHTCKKLVKQGNVKALRKYLVIEAGYTRKLADCVQNDFILSCIEQAKIEHKKLQAKKGVKHFAYTVPSCVSAENLVNRTF